MLRPPLVLVAAAFALGGILGLASPIVPAHAQGAGGQRGGSAPASVSIVFSDATARDAARKAVDLLLYGRPAPGPLAGIAPPLFDRLLAAFRQRRLEGSLALWEDIPGTALLEIADGRQPFASSDIVRRFTRGALDDGVPENCLYARLEFLAENIPPRAILACEDPRDERPLGTPVYIVASAKPSRYRLISSEPALPTYEGSL